jgi:hypothetical protein
LISARPISASVLSQVKLINAMLISEIITGIWILVSASGTYAGWTGHQAESKLPLTTAGIAQGVGADQVKIKAYYCFREERFLDFERNTVHHLCGRLCIYSSYSFLYLRSLNLVMQVQVQVGGPQVVQAHAVGGPPVVQAQVVQTQPNDVKAPI